MIPSWFERLRSRTAALLHDLLMIPLGWFGAYWLRFNLGQIPDLYLEGALVALPLVILVQGTVYWSFGLYRGVWRFASLPDLVRIFSAVAVGSLATLFALFIFNRMEGIPRSVPFLFLVSQLLLLAGPRLFYRWIKDRRVNPLAGERVLIVGAGRAGEMLVRDMLREPHRTYVPVAFLDDKLRRHGGEVQGIPVRGGTDSILDVVSELDIDLIMLAIPSASAKEMQQLVDLCERAGKPFRTVPQLQSLMTGQVSVNQLRPVCIEDLLGRNPITLDWDAMRGDLAGREILVSGAGGSIGSELCRQIAKANPARLILLDNSEYNLYRMEMELGEHQGDVIIDRRLMDVTDRAGIFALLGRLRPQLVFHAAAYKHVPMLEDQVRSAVRNNILGTRILAEAADACGCERFVLISTDKAVNPTNIMGATKRVAELLCQELDKGSACRFVTVRFGNVLASAGSVVPLFQQQIRQGGPVTVTDPEIERFFMTIPEACQLIMQAAIIGNGGEIFVLDMGEPVKIRYLAEQMIRLSGRIPDVDVRIEYVGLRPGEKLYEELFYDKEHLVPTAHPKIRVARHSQDAPSLALDSTLQRLAEAVRDNREDKICRILHSLMPHWQSTDGTKDRRGCVTEPDDNE